MASDNHRNDRHDDRISLPSHLLWRSVLGSPAAYSGSSSRGMYLVDDDDNFDGGDDHNDPKVHKENVIAGARIMTRRILTDGRRMRHLPCSLHDRIVGSHFIDVSSETMTNYSLDVDGNGSRTRSKSSTAVPPPLFSSMRLLSHPRIVGFTSSRQSSTISWHEMGRSTSKSGSVGISCMDLDNGRDSSSNNSITTQYPSRYLLVGSSGNDCSIALYDLSYFGSDSYINNQNHENDDCHRNRQQQQHVNDHRSTSTHRPIARSVKHMSVSQPYEYDDASSVPTGHRHPILSVHWYPADTYGAFVSTSISGEVLVWDARNFIPVFATYNKIYSQTVKDVDTGGWRSMVAPIRCTDLPKTPEGCPHGNALLALGLGDGGRGAVRLCDAFRGGSATHELSGHAYCGNGSGGSGGVNAVAWDPCHPFRLASGGDDGAVRLWDIRKAGTAACLGVLDREDSRIGREHSEYANYDQCRKRHRAAINASRQTYDGIQSHSGPVTALAFAPNGEDLVSSGVDGKIQHWDLRPESCFVSAVSTISESGKRMLESGCNSDSAVAVGGRLLPTRFAVDRSKLNASFKKTGQSSLPQNQCQRHRLAIIQPGSRATATLISTVNNGKYSSVGQITGYSLFGSRGQEPGGYPSFVLSGHLADVSSLIPVQGVWDNMAIGRRRNTSLTNQVNFLTGGSDGMVLAWGGSHSHRINRSNDYCGHDVSKRRSFQCHKDSLSHGLATHEKPTIEDVDSW